MVDNKLSGVWVFYNEDSTLDRKIEYESDLKMEKKLFILKMESLINLRFFLMYDLALRTTFSFMT